MHLTEREVEQVVKHATTSVIEHVELLLARRKGGLASWRLPEPAAADLETSVHAQFAAVIRRLNLPDPREERP